MINFAQITDMNILMTAASNIIALLVQYMFAATSRMTAFEEFKRLDNSIEVHWKELQYSAAKLELAVICKYDYNEEINLIDKFSLPPHETSLVFSGLPPSSECTFTLKAVYNPASIDAGISVSYSTMPPSK